MYTIYMFTYNANSHKLFVVTTVKPCRILPVLMFKHAFRSVPSRLRPHFNPLAVGLRRNLHNR